jgi:type I restriction enzyme S subunit
MKNGWSDVALGDVLHWRAPDTEVAASESYDFAGAYSHGGGIFRKHRVSGSSFAYDRLTRLRKDEFVYPKLMAWEGALGLVPLNCDGCFVSPEFQVFQIDSTRLHPRFLDFYMRRPRVWSDLGRLSPGTNLRRRRLNAPEFLKYRISMPSLAEQQRVVAHLDAIESRLSRAQKLREEAAEESRALVRSLVHAAHCRGVRSVPMHDLVNWRSPDVIVSQSESYPFAGVYSFGRGVFRKEAISGMDFSYDRLTRLRVGELTYPKLMAWEGALGIVPPECDGCHVSPEFPVFTVDASKVLPVILDIHFKTPAVWKELAAISTGTNLRRRRLNPNAFLSYRFPLPPMEVQQHAKAIADRASSKRTLQSEAGSIEKALIPSLLDKIFNS